jgi:hypothetical protein
MNGVEWPLHGTDIDVMYEGDEQWYHLIGKQCDENLPRSLLVFRSVPQTDYDNKSARGVVLQKDSPPVLRPNCNYAADIIRPIRRIMPVA